MATPTLWGLVVATVIQAYLSATEPFVSKDDFRTIILDKDDNRNVFVSPCNSWIRMPSGTRVVFQSPKRNRGTHRRTPGYRWWGSSSHFRGPRHLGLRHVQKCEWVFQALDSEDHIEINCHKFNLGRKFFGLCLGGALNIFSRAFEVDRYCGRDGPTDFETGQNSAYVQFKPSPFRGGNRRAFRRRNIRAFECTATAIGSHCDAATEPTTTTTPSTTTTTTTTSTTTTTTIAPGSCRCGRKGAPYGARIVGGAQAGLHEFPWQGALVDKDDPTQVVCGAVVITDQHVLTAAHCLSPPNDPSSLRVALGEHDISTTSETSETLYRDIDSTVIHEDFNLFTLDNDIALVQLSEAVDLTASEAIKPICLPDPSKTYENIVATVSGWGLLNLLGEQPNVLQQVNLTTHTNVVCLAMTPNRPLTENMLCASDFGKDSCQGDSGGPLMVQDGGHYVLIGLVSYGILCANPLYPGVYVRVANYVDWINEKVGDAMTCPE